MVRPTLASTAISDGEVHEYRKQPAKSVIRVTYRLVLEKGHDGWIVVRCPDLAGVVTQGKTEEEAIKNGIEAIDLMLESEQDKEFNVMIIRRFSA